MAEGARVAEAAGADIIDINMGCPARHVTGGQSGSALMRDLDHALALIEATIAAVKVPVTLKMRLGWDDRSLNAPELARRAEARRRADDYRAWPHALPVLQGLGRLEPPCARSGMRSPCRSSSTATSPRSTKAVQALEVSGADAVMIGRGAQGQPWLPGQIGRRLETGQAEDCALARRTARACPRAL